MKKIIIVLLLISSEAFCETILLKAPFLESRQEISPVVAGRLVVPPLVAGEVYLSSLLQDCRQYEETLAKFSAQINAGELASLISEPLPYSMKNTYEVELDFPSHSEFSLNENGLLLLEVQTGSFTLDWPSEMDLLKNSLNPLDAFQLTEMDKSVRVRFSRRDQLCSYINGKLKVNLKASALWQVTEARFNEIQTNTGLLAESMNPVLGMNKGEQFKAALIGRAMYLAVQNPAFKADKRFAGVEYLWNLFFESENSLKKTSQWIVTGNNTFLQPSHVLIKLGGTK